MTTTISLAELNATSSLLQRVDRKYLLDLTDAEGFIEEISATSRLLEINGSTWFDYRSCYFDTPDLFCYRQAGHKRRRRFKVRTREYLSSGSNWLEVKTRGVRGTTIKDRIPHPARTLMPSDQVWIAATLAHRGVDTAPVPLLQPTLVTSYMRRTLQTLPAQNHGPTRVTIDRRLAVELTNNAPTGALFADLSHKVIVETKGFPRPSGIDHLLYRMGYRPRSISKYGIGTALLRIDQPAFRWTRLMNTDFAA